MLRDSETVSCIFHGFCSHCSFFLFFLFLFFSSPRRGGLGLSVFILGVQSECCGIQLPVWPDNKVLQWNCVYKLLWMKKSFQVKPWQSSVAVCQVIILERWYIWALVWVSLKISSFPADCSLISQKQCVCHCGKHNKMARSMLCIWLNVSNWLHCLFTVHLFSWNSFTIY